MRILQSHEVELKGSWVKRDGIVSGDAVCNRINWLVENKLRIVAYSKDYGAWEILYKDPHDGRYWEKTYPESHLHGGGPPLLRCISQSVAEKKYGKRGSS